MFDSLPRQRSLEPFYSLIVYYIKNTLLAESNYLLKRRYRSLISING